MYRTFLAQGKIGAAFTEVDVRRTEFFLALLTGALAIALPAAPAYSQDGRATVQAEAEDNDRNVIIVTAGRREQNIINVETTVVAFDQEFIENSNIDSIQDLVALTPGFEARREDLIGENNRFSIRGVSSVTNAATATAGVYLDDVPLTLGAVFNVPNIRTFDLQRVEILKGPQGTLFGAGAMGGVVRYISNKPDTREFGGQVRLEASTTERGGENYSVDAVLNVPIVEDKLAVRVVGSYADDDGFIDLVNFPTGPLENVNTRETESIRGIVRWTPLENLTIDLQALYERTTNSGFNAVQNNFVFVPPGPPAFVMPTSLFDDETTMALAGSESEFQQYSATVSLDVDWAEIVSTTSIYDTVFDGEFPLPDLILFDRDGSGFSQEVRIATKLDGAFNFVGGVFYQDASLDDDFGLPGIGLVAPSTEDREQLSFFGELYVEVLPDLEATVGLRHFTEDSTQSTVTNLGNFQPSPPVERSADNTRTVPKFALSYTGIDGVNFYATASRGFRVGGNNLSVFPMTPPTFDGDSIWAYELGAKFSLFDGRLNGALAGFYTDWTDIQTVISGFGAPTIVNAGDASIQGIELQLNYEVIEGLNLGLSGSLLDAKIDEDIGADNPAILTFSAGDRIPLVTEESLVLFANYTTPISDDWFLFMTGDLAFNGDQVTVDQSVGTASTTFANARIGAKSEKFEIAAFVRNLTNENTTSFFNDLFFSIPRPRTIGVELISRF
ncbi:MAG: TonB-dependent receptor [Pseudomonadota bacterium]